MDPLADRPGAIYCRLSRTDREQPGRTEEKFAHYIQMASARASQIGIQVPPERIICERESGGSIAKRPGILKVLEWARLGDIGYLITYDWDRLCRADLRGEVDVIEDALCTGNVTLLTDRDKIEFTADDFDSLQVDVRSLVARAERRKYIQRLRDHNIQRAQAGIRSGGRAPYGYIWVPPRYDQRQLIEKAHYEIIANIEISDPDAAAAFVREQTEPIWQACLRDDRLDHSAYIHMAKSFSPSPGRLLPGIRLISGEYAILCEAYRRIWNEGLGTIVRSWTRSMLDTGYPQMPSVGRTAYQGQYWHPSTLRDILLNPHNAGYPASRSRVRRGQQVKLPESSWVFAAEEQTYPHPITLADRERLRAQLSARGAAIVSQPHAYHLLSGLLYCCRGRRMSAHRETYSCDCSMLGNNHATVSILRAKIEPAAIEVFNEVMKSLPREITKFVPETGRERSDINADLNRALKELHEVERMRDNLTREASIHIEIYGRDSWEEALRRNKSLLDQAGERVKLLRTVIEEPDLAAVIDLAKAVRSIGFEAWWNELPFAGKRAALRTIITRVEMFEGKIARSPSRAVRICIHAPLLRYYTPPDPYPIPLHPPSG